MTIQPDGRVVVAGSASTNLGPEIGVVRFESNGAADASFGVGGKVTTEVGMILVVGSDVLVQPGGRIVVAGVASDNGPSAFDLVVAGLVGAAVPVPPAGYWMVSSAGDVYAFGDAKAYGNAPVGGTPAVNLEPTPSGKGYLIVDEAGHVFTYGDGTYHGGVNVQGLAPGEKVTSLSVTATGQGYWVFTSRGRVETFGDATFFGDMSKQALNGPVLDSIPTPSGKGYFMVASDGASSPSATRSSVARWAKSASTPPSSRWCPIPTATATGWSPPTAGSSPSPPASTGRWATSA